MFSCFVASGLPYSRPSRLSFLVRCQTQLGSGLRLAAVFVVQGLLFDCALRTHVRSHGDARESLTAQQHQYRTETTSAGIFVRCIVADKAHYL